MSTNVGSYRYVIDGTKRIVICLEEKILSSFVKKISAVFHMPPTLKIWEHSGFDQQFS